MKRNALLSHLAHQICSLDRHRPVRVAIDGVDGSGKTWLADELVEPIEKRGRPVIRASVDGFHNPRAIRYEKGADSAPGFYHDSYDYPRLFSLLLDPLAPNGSRRYHTAAFDHTLDLPTPTPQLWASENAVLLLDGLFLHRDVLRDCWDYSLFIRVDFETAFGRLLVRDLPEDGAGGDTFGERWSNRYRAGQLLYLREADPEHTASIVIDNTRFDEPEIVRTHP